MSRSAPQVSVLVVKSVDEARREAADGSVAKSNVTRSHGYHRGVMEHIDWGRYDGRWFSPDCGEGDRFLLERLLILWKTVSAAFSHI